MSHHYEHKIKTRCKQMISTSVKNMSQWKKPISLYWIVRISFPLVLWNRTHECLHVHISGHWRQETVLFYTNGALPHTTPYPSRLSEAKQQQNGNIKRIFKVLVCNCNYTMPVFYIFILNEREKGSMLDPWLDHSCKPETLTTSPNT